LKEKGGGNAKLREGVNRVGEERKSGDSKRSHRCGLNKIINRLEKKIGGRGGKGGEGGGGGRGSGGGGGGGGEAGGEGGEGESGGGG